MNIALSETVLISVAAEPVGDVIFLPTDSVGTPGQLNGEILRKLGLPQKLPGRKELEKGYAFKRARNQKICFVVTVGPLDTAESLKVNFQAALRDEEMADVATMWLPLMGTGAGGLAYHDSFYIAFNVLRSSGWLAQPQVRIVISLPDKISSEEISDLIQRIEKVKETLFNESQGTLSPSAKEVYGFEQTAAVSAALEFANSLASLRRQSSDRLSTTVLFFALAESQSSAAPRALNSDLSAEFFSAAVHQLAGARYQEAWQSYFLTNLHLAGQPPGRALSRPTSNIEKVLTKAREISLHVGKNIVGIDHLVEALLSLEKSRLQQSLERMAIKPEALLQEYRDAKLGQVAMTLHNDVASGEDRLGYDSYAEAITEFLTHAKTPPPLSISIQAPWGGGKSSLMKLIREKLDPTRERDANKPKVGSSSPLERKLRLGTVLKLLDQREAFTVAAAPDATRLWTIWFNAWKYETSEQIWAGLVDAIVSQIGERLPLLEREKFLLKLQLARIDDGIIRRKIYDRVVTIWWSKVRAWTLAGGAAIVSLFGVRVAAPSLPEEIQKAVELWSGTGMLATQIILSIYLVGMYFQNRSKTRQEPATFSLSEYIRVPDYNKSVGEIHQIHADLRRVLAVVPKKVDEIENSPIVIFIDDLDRCSPMKIASVVEGVSMLLASDTYRCMFVIGMDPQMIAAALEKAHEDVRKQLPRYERTVPLGWRFMDKFIQLPFTIPPSSSERLEEYVSWLGGVAPTAEYTQPKPGGVTPIIISTPLTPGTPRHSTVAPQKIEDLVGSTDTPKPDPNPAPVTAFVESRDVGQITRKVAKYTVGNPREVKRMVNLARLYLSLRDARRRRDETWRSPDLDQYARWIAVTLRWPDMMRWLQWGADEASWSSQDRANELIVRRLHILETGAAGASSAKDWREKLSLQLHVPSESETDWACDPKLFDFFREEGQRDTSKRLSAAAEQTFW
jgi:hypothetical protein